MKRKDIIVGGEYATDSGLHVRIEDLEPGWGIDPITKDWVKREQQSTRFIKGKGYVPYQTNINIKATVVRDGRKTVVEPRHLLSTWDDYEAAQEAAGAAQSLVQANAEALAARASMVGLEPLVDPERQEVVLSFDGFDTLLRRARV